MKEILQSIFSNTQERIKNPFIGAFVTSWLAINWRPVSIFLFSTKSIERKITYIELHHVHWEFTFLYPMVAAVGYVLILPHINLLFETLLGFAGNQRNRILMEKQELASQNRLQIALGDIKLEEAKTEYRERNSHNQLVEDLQKRLTESELMLNEERSSNNITVKELQTQLHDNVRLIAEERAEVAKKISDATSEVDLLRRDILEAQKLVDQQKIDLDRRTMSLTTQIDEKNKSISNLEKNIDQMRLTIADLSEQNRQLLIDSELSLQLERNHKQMLEENIKSLRAKYGLNEGSNPN